MQQTFRVPYGIAFVCRTSLRVSTQNSSSGRRLRCGVNVFAERFHREGLEGGGTGGAFWWE